MHGLGQIIDPPVKVICRAQKNDRAGDVFQVHSVLNCGGVQFVVGRTIADATTGRRGGLHPIIGGRRHHREFASHRMPVDTKLRGIHLRLLFQERQCPARRQRAEEPGIVAR